MGATKQHSDILQNNETSRIAIVEAMAEASWIAAGEPMAWRTLPADVRRGWMSYQDAALSELERRVPEVRHALSSCTPV